MALMALSFVGQIEVVGFQQRSDGQQSGWRLIIKRQDNFAVVCLHWGDKEIPTHVAFADLEKFKQMVNSL
jgi:hypothetical protein